MLAELILALVAPNITILLLTVLAKFVPVMVTLVPAGPCKGVKEDMTGGAETGGGKYVKPGFE